MAIRGPKPKPQGQTRHRNKLAHEWTEVPNVPFEDAPELPERGDGRLWPARTLVKWQTWSTMPHCRLWGPSTWEFAFTAVELAARVHEGDVRLASELRAWEKTLGTTLESRRDQRIRYVESAQGNEGDSEAGLTNLALYREL